MSNAPSIPKPGECEKILSNVFFSQRTGMRCRIEYRELSRDEDEQPIMSEVLCQFNPGMKDSDRWRALRTPTDRDWREAKSDRLRYNPPKRTEV